MMKISLPEKNTVLKMLIAAGIFAILLSLYTQYGKPYLNERALEKQDAIRIRDIDALNLAVQDALKASSTAYLGEPNTVYISIPSDDPTCANLDLPSLPQGWSYRCSSQENYKKADGTGWVPAHFTNTPSSLPIDPLNTAETLNYYSYVASSTDYVITATLDTKKHLREKALTDNGTDTFRYEAGNESELWSQSQGLIGYWPINETKGGAFADASFNKNHGRIFGNQEWTGRGFQFSGKSFVKFSNSNSFNKVGKKDYSLLFLMKNPGTRNQSILEKWSSSSKYPWAIRIGSYNLIFATYDGGTWSSAALSEEPLLDNRWHHLSFVRNTNSTSLLIYLDGKLTVSGSDNTSLDVSNTDDFVLGNRKQDGDHAFTGSISNLLLFNRALSAIEIEKVNHITSMFYEE